MTERIRQSIKGLYGAFGDVARPTAISFCDHCRSAEELKPLLRKDLREITADEIWQYAHSVMLTLGSEEDFLYYCPRLLELLTPLDSEMSEFGLPDEPIVLGKLRLAGWQAWPANKRAAVMEWAEAIFAAMGEVVFVLGVDSWICGMAQFLDDVVSRLDPLLRGTPAGDANLVNFYESNSERLMKTGKVSGAFWEESNPNFAPVAAWLQSEPVKKRLDAIYGLGPVSG
jgi:hypothetical protein